MMSIVIRFGNFLFLPSNTNRQFGRRYLSSCCLFPLYSLVKQTFLLVPEHLNLPNFFLFKQSDLIHIRLPTKNRDIFVLSLCAVKFSKLVRLIWEMDSHCQLYQLLKVCLDTNSSTKLKRINTNLIILIHFSFCWIRSWFLKTETSV